MQIFLKYSQESARVSTSTGELAEGEKNCIIMSVFASDVYFLLAYNGE